MKKEFLEKLDKWFDSYVAGFYGIDEFVDENIRLKEEHSRKVCDEMLFLTDEMKLDENRSRIGRAVALLHDIGRFEQFKQYRTYNDPRSINHSCLGARLINELKILDGIDENEKQLITTAVRYHGEKELPVDLAGDALLFTKLVRDADKLDIFRVVLSYYKQYREDPTNFKLEVEMPDTPGYSQEIVERVVKGKNVDYRLLENWNDMKICQLGWVYDINFDAALKRIMQKRYLDMLFEFLPEDENISKVHEAVFGYVRQRLNGSTGNPVSA